MTKQQKWSGVKLTKEELKEIKKTERIELIAEILAFGFIIIFAFLVIVSVMFILGIVER